MPIVIWFKNSSNFPVHINRQSIKTVSHSTSYALRFNTFMVTLRIMWAITPYWLFTHTTDVEHIGVLVNKSIKITVQRRSSSGIQPKLNHIKGAMRYVLISASWWQPYISVCRGLRHLASLGCSSARLGRRVIARPALSQGEKRVRAKRSL